MSRGEGRGREGKGREGRESSHQMGLLSASSFAVSSTVQLSGNWEQGSSKFHKNSIGAH